MCCPSSGVCSGASIALFEAYSDCLCTWWFVCDVWRMAYGVWRMAYSVGVLCVLFCVWFVSWCSVYLWWVGVSMVDWPSGLRRQFKALV